MDTQTLLEQKGGKKTPQNSFLMNKNKKNKKLLEPINKFRKVVEYKIDV